MTMFKGGSPKEREAMDIKGFSHIYLPSRNAEESIEFYTKILGFKLFRKYKLDGRLSAYLELGGVLLNLGYSATDTPDQDGRTEPRIGLEVPDINAAVAELKAAGVEIVTEPWAAQTLWGWQATIKDPSGYIITLREWRAPDGPHYMDWIPEHDNAERVD